MNFNLVSKLHLMVTKNINKTNIGTVGNSKFPRRIDRSL